ncbi:MAG: (d)CMP kinase [Clostridia bacterium]|nr:(d)CMP kinase [Clostridia bacterium]
MDRINIAIDGPAGAGKSTVAKLVARALGYIYIDTGAMYRAAAYKALINNLDLDDQEALTRMVQGSAITLAYDTEGNQQVFLDGQDVSVDIRTPEVTRSVSKVAAVRGVREEMVRLQQKLAETKGVVMDGRDVGTFILPKAEKKFYLTASIEERAGRRYLEMQSRGYEADLEEIKADIAQRDQMDREREFAPLVQAPDALLVDSSDMSIQQVVDKILEVSREGSE